MIVPGNIGGILRRGAPALWAGPLRHHVLVTEIRTLTGEQTAYVLDGDRPQRCAMSDLVLDMSDPLARDIACRWAHERGHDLRPYSDLAGHLTPEQSAEALGWCVRSIAAGGRPPVGILDRWTPGGLGLLGVGWRRRRAAMVGSFDPTCDALICNTGGWWIDRGRPGMGHETGPEGRACADRAALAAGYALIDNGVLVLPPLPDGAA